MPVQISLKKATQNPTSSSGLTSGEPVFNSSNNTFWIGRGAGNSPIWMGAPITGDSGAINSGLTGYLPTTSAVKDYVLSVVPFNYVVSVNGLTGVVTNIAETTGATFTGCVAFNAGLTTSNIWVTSGATFNSGIYVTGNGVITNYANIGDIHTSSIIVAPVGEIISTNIYNDRIEWHNENSSSLCTLLGHTGSNSTSILPAVGGLLASNTTTNPFLNIQTFNAGISASGATFTGNISAPNIVNSIAGLTGVVGVTAGTNITVSITGNNIQISSNVSSGVTPAFAIAMSIAL
jgi:hypothetical protein